MSKNSNTQQYNSPSMIMNTPGSGPPINTQNMKGRLSAGEITQTPVMAQTSQYQSPTVSNLSPHPSLVPTPNPVANQSPSMSNIVPLRKLSQQSLSAHDSPAMLQSPHANQGSASSGFQPHRLSVLQNSSAIEVADETQPEKPNTIKKYTPIKKVADSHGFLIKKISDYGDELEALKPVYLFAPELGALNLHALTMSLQNYSASNEGEAFSALNTLLVTTADDNFSFDISKAPELINALVELGQKILSRVLNRQSELPDYSDIGGSTEDNIESVFRKYVAPLNMQGEDVAYVVDSLTGDLVVDDDSDIEIDEIFSPNPGNFHLETSPSEEIEIITKCELPDFMTAMHLFRSENKHHFSKMQTKGPLNEQVFLVDSLITITMTLRNLSLAEDSLNFMARNVELKNLVFEIIKQVATKSEAFVFERKRLCLLKDCLMILDHHGPQIELQSLEEAFLTFLLVSSFGPKLSGDDDDPNSELSLVQAPLDDYTYLPYAVDVFTKLLVREPKNKVYFQALLGGSLNITYSSSCPGSDSVKILHADQEETRKLLSAYFHGDLSKLKQGVLLTRAFKLFMSIVPFSFSGSEFSKAIFINMPSILQALFGAKLLIDLLPPDEIHEGLAVVMLRFLTTNIQAVIFNLTKSVFAFIAESIKIENSSSEHKIAVYVSIKALIVINSLFANAVRLQTACSEGEIENILAVTQELSKLTDLFRIQHDADFLLNSLSVSNVDPDLPEQILRLLGLMTMMRRS